MICFNQKLVIQASMLSQFNNSENPSKLLQNVYRIAVTAERDSQLHYRCNNQ